MKPAAACGLFGRTATMQGSEGMLRAKQPHFSDFNELCNLVSDIQFLRFELRNLPTRSKLLGQQTKMNDNSPKGYIDIIETQLTQKLGASDVVYTEKVTLFIAHKNSVGEALINIADWVFEAERVLANIGGGATSVQVRGTWLGQRDQPLHEETTLVYSYATPQAILDNIVMLRRFLHRYGRESVQGEVALLLENTDGQWFYRVHPPYDPV